MRAMLHRSTRSSLNPARITRFNGLTISTPTGFRTAAASIITKKYMKTRDPLLLQNAKDAISQADLIVFGGAPVFNYLYQTFYERTALTLEIAQQFNKPVIFLAKYHYRIPRLLPVRYGFREPVYPVLPPGIPSLLSDFPADLRSTSGYG